MEKPAADYLLDVGTFQGAEGLVREHQYGRSAKILGSILDVS
jgi:hypothetical protein